MKSIRALALVLAVIVLNTSRAFSQGYDATILADKPTSYWPMQETSGSTVHDIAGTNNGTMYVATDATGSGNTHSSFVVSSGADFGLGGPGVLYGVSGDTAIYFTNATGTEIVVPYSSNLDTPQFTAEAWLNIPNFPIGLTNSPGTSTNTGDICPLAFQYNSGSLQAGWIFDLLCDLSGTSKLGQLDAWAAKYTTNSVNGTDKPTGWSMLLPTNTYNGKWAYVAMTYDGTNQNAYVDGVLLASASVVYANPGRSHTFNTKNQPLVMGSYMSSTTARARFYQGGMSHVAVYSNALTSSQIINHYFTGIYGGSVSPTIVTAPVGLTNYIGYSPTLSVSAGGTAPLRYQWSKNSTPILGATNASLTLTSLVLTNAGNYSVVITNALGSTNSGTVSLGVLPLPSNPYQAAVISQIPLAYYPLNETTGTNAADLIGAGNNGATYLNGPVLGASGASSYLGTAVTLDGVTNGVYVNNPTAMNFSGTITIEAWVQPMDITDDQIIVTHGLGAPNAGNKSSDTLGIGVDDNGNYNYYIGNYVKNPVSATAYGASNSIPSGDLGQWVYLAGTYDGTAWNLYRNGVEVSSNSAASGAVTSDVGWAFGARNSSWTGQAGVEPPFLNGSIDNVAIYNYALTPATILQHYQIGLTGSYTTTPTMSIQQSGANVVVSWTSGYLQEAASVTGPWTYDNTNTVTSPYTVGATNPARYFRATTQPPQ